MLSRSITVIAGFLGEKKDWDFLETDKLGVQNIFPVAPCSFSAKSFDHFSDLLIEEMQKNGSHYVLGYSLGGRLALHSVIKNPSFFKGAIFISTHPGLLNSEEREKRLKNDEELAAKVLTQPWKDLMELWESQKVFQSGSFVFQRKESNFKRIFLAEALKNYSLGKQNNFREEIAKLNLPILWITGSLDEKFSQCAKTLGFSHPSSLQKIFSDAGHRLPWEKPEELQKAVYSFLDNI